MYGKAFAPEYQGELGAALGVNSSYEEVLATASRAQADAGTALERAGPRWRSPRPTGGSAG